MFFGSSGWLLNIGMHLHSPPGIVLDFARDFFLISQGKKRFQASYPLIWYILQQLFTSTSVKNGRYLPRRFAVTYLEQVPRSGYKCCDPGIIWKLFSSFLNSYFSQTNDFHSTFLFPKLCSYKLCI